MVRSRIARMLAPVCFEGVSSAAVSSLADLMTREILAVAPEDTLGEAAEKMVERGVGSAVVLDYGRLIGIFTERDLMKAVAGRVHSSEARVREWMTADPITVTTDVSPADAARLMLDNGFRHLPVVEDDRAIGIVSIRDVARWGADAIE
jgi:CBS domain-containing protein